MQKIQINRVGFAEVFYYADKHFNIDWNTCCQLFHDTEVFKYNNVTEIYMSDVKHNFTYRKEIDKLTGEELLQYIINFRGTDISTLSEKDKQYIILLNFMLENEIEDMEVDSR